MIDISFLTNPIFLISVAVPTVIAVWQFVDARKKEPKELRKIDAETRAAEAQGVESLLASVSTINRLISEVKDQVNGSVMLEIGRLKQAVETRMDTIETRLNNHINDHQPPGGAA